MGLIGQPVLPWDIGNVRHKAIGNLLGNRGLVKRKPDSVVNFYFGKSSCNLSISFMVQDKFASFFDVVRLSFPDF